MLTGHLLCARHHTGHAPAGYFTSCGEGEEEEGDQEEEEVRINLPPLLSII